MHIFRQEIWCIEDGGADSILRMEVLTIRDVFILNFAPVSLSVSPPGPREFVMHFNSRRQIIAVLVRLRHKIWVAYKAKSAPLPKNWLELSTACGTLFTSSPRSQHSGIVIRKQQVFSYSECFEYQCTCGQFSLFWTLFWGLKKVDLLSRVFFFSEFALLRAFLSAQKNTQGPAQPLQTAEVLSRILKLTKKDRLWDDDLWRFLW